MPQHFIQVPFNKFALTMLIFFSVWIEITAENMEINVKNVPGTASKFEFYFEDGALFM